MKIENQFGAVDTLVQTSMAALRAVVCVAGALACSVAARAQTCPLSYGTTDPAKSHWLFLYFPTASDSTFPAYTTNASPVAPFDVAALSPGIGTTAQLISEIGKIVIDDYCEFNVQVHTTTTNPATLASPPARRVTVGIGDDNNSGLWGQAQEVDIGDAIDIDFARVWAGTYVTCEGGTGPFGPGGCSTTGALTGTNATLDHWAQAIGGTAAHEAGHTYGLAHTDDDPSDDPSQAGPPALPGEDPYYQHLMPAGYNLTGPQRADYRRHFSDRTYGILATNVGLSIQTMHNWNLVNPNAESASSLAIDFLSSLPSISSSWTYAGSESPWLNPTVSGPSGTTVFKGVTYNKYRITWSAPNPVWMNSSPGVVAGGAVFHIGATFTGVDFNSPDPIIIQNVTLIDASSTPLVLHPRLPGYDAGTVDSVSGDFSVHFFATVAADALQLQSARIYQLPRVAAIESMVGEGQPLARDQSAIRPWSVAECAPASLRDVASCTIANLKQPPHVQFVHRLGEPGVADCSRGGNLTNSGKPGSPDRANALDYEGPICAGTVQDPFPSTTVYVIARFVDPSVRHFDPASKTYIVGPVVSTVYYQFAGTRQRPTGGGTVGPRARLFAGVLTGASWPVGSMTRSFNPGFHFQGFLEANITPPAVIPAMRLGLQLGFHEFDAKNQGMVPAASLHVTNLSLTGRVLGGGSYRPYILAGLGLYHVMGVLKPGAQFGAGLDVPVSREVSLVTGLSFHAVTAPGPQIGRLQWFDGFLGLTLRLP